MGIKNFDKLDGQTFKVNGYDVMIRTDGMYLNEDGTNKKTYMARLNLYKDSYHPGIVAERKLELHTTLPVRVKQKIAMVDVESDGVQLVFIDGNSGKHWHHVEPLERIQTTQEFKNLLAYSIAKI